MKKGLIILSLMAASVLMASNAPVLTGKEPKLTHKQAQAVELSKEWIDANEEAARGQYGSVNFLYGSTLPSIVTAPLRSTDIQLEPGEKIRDIQAGDTVRWVISPSVSGSGADEVSHVIIKPTDIGLETTIYIYTDKRPYFLHVVSRKKDYMPVVSFDYPDKTKAKWDAYYKQKTAIEETQKLVVENDAPARNLGNLDFDYKVEGEASWKPVRVYNDGVQTYVQMPEKMKFNEAPVLMVLDHKGTEKIVNYRLKGDRFIVDKLFDHAELIVGVGDDQEKIEIYRNTSPAVHSQADADALALISGQKKGR